MGFGVTVKNSLLHTIIRNKKVCDHTVFAHFSSFCLSNFFFKEKNGGFFTALSDAHYLCLLIHQMRTMTFSARGTEAEMGSCN